MNGGADPDAFADLVEGLGADVLAVQEVDCAQAERLSAQFDHGVVEPGGDFTGMGLLCRRPGSIERVELSWGFAQTLQLDGFPGDERGRALEISNLHIAAPHMLRPAPGLWLRWRQARELAAYLEHADTRQRFPRGDAASQYRCASASSSSATNASQGQGAPSCPGLRKRSTPPPRLLVGDFNATPYWPWYRRMVSQFTDAAVAVADKTGTPARPTWGPWPGARKVLRIDHGFLRGLAVEGFEVLDVVGSDHRALVMDLSLPV